MKKINLKVATDCICLLSRRECYLGISGTIEGDYYE